MRVKYSSGLEHKNDSNEQSKHDNKILRGTMICFPHLVCRRGSLIRLMSFFTKTLMIWIAQMPNVSALWFGALHFGAKCNCPLNINYETDVRDVSSNADQDPTSEFALLNEVSNNAASVPNPETDDYYYMSSFSKCCSGGKVKVGLLLPAARVSRLLYQEPVLRQDISEKYPFHFHLHPTPVSCFPSV